MPDRGWRHGRPLCGAFVFGFGLWSFSSHVTALTGGSLWALLTTFSLLGSLALGGRWLYRRRRARAAVAAETLPPPLSRSVARPAFHASPSEPPLSASDTPLDTALLWALVVLAVAVTLVAHRPDADDTTYMNRAVRVADSPHLPILHAENIHDVPAELKPVTKVQALELLAGALSFITGVPAIAWTHLVFSPLAAMLTILAYGDVLRLLAPKRWVWGVLAVVVFLSASGDNHWTHGNFSFVRLHQGKGILLSVGVPLLIAYSLRFVLHPGLRHWLLLAALQVAALGLSSTALMVAPVVAALALVTASFESPTLRAGLTRLGLGALSLLYPAAMGLYLHLPSVTAVRRMLSEGEPNWVVLVGTANVSTAKLLERSIDWVFGSGLLALASLLILLTAWYWCETRLARRLCWVFPLAVGLGFLNPFIPPGWVVSMGMYPIYWRVFWILPVPLLAALALLAPLTVTRPRLPWKPPRQPRARETTRTTLLRYGAYACLLVLVLALAERTIFSAANRGVHLGLPGLKVTPDYQVAAYLAAALRGRQAGGERPNVLVPEAVSIWLPTLHHHPYPLVARFHGATSLGRERAPRLALKLYIMGEERPDGAPAVLRQAIEHYRLAAVCVPQSNPWADEIRQALRASGLTKQRELLSYEVWFTQDRRGGVGAPADPRGRSE